MDPTMWIVLAALAVIVPLAFFLVRERSRGSGPRDTSRFRMPEDVERRVPLETDEIRRQRAAESAANEAKNAPDHVGLQAKAGRQMLAANRFLEAIPFLKQAVKLEPSADHLAMLGYAYLGVDRLEGAMEVLQQARAQEPGHVEAWFYWCLALDAQGETRLSNQELERLLELHPSHAAAKSDLALRWARRGNSQQALIQLESAVDLSPDFIPARVALIRLLCERGQFADAKPQLNWLTAHGIAVQVVTRQDEMVVQVDGDEIYRGALQRAED